MRLFLFVKEYNVETESAKGPMLYFFQPIRYQIFYALVILSNKADSARPILLNIKFIHSR